MSDTFCWPIRVYYEDTDSAGVVYYANYLRFMERARTEWLRSLGIEQDILRDQYGVIFVVKSAQIDFIQPAKFNDELEVVSSISELRKASMIFQQDIRMDKDKDEVCQATIRIACLCVDTMKPCPIPNAILQGLPHAS